MVRKNNPHKIKVSIGNRIFDGFNILFMLFLCVIMLYPYLNQIALSLNDGADTMFGGITIFPRKFTLVNYKAALTSTGFSTAAMISVLRVVIGSLHSLAVTTLAAYCLTKKQLPYRRAITFFFLIPVFLHAGVIPNYMIFRYIGVLNTFWMYVLPGAFTFFNMVVMRTYMDGLPPSLGESAQIDGATEVQVLVKIYLPLCKPIIATLLLWVAVGYWNDWTTTLMYITKPNLYTLQYIMMQVVKESETVQRMASELAMANQDVSNITPTPEAVKSATLVITTLPIVMVYPFLQKHFVKGVMIGAVKE